MKYLIILLSVSVLLFITGCSSTCMEYRSATAAARSEKNLKRAEEWGLKALESPECNPGSDALVPYFLATEVYLVRKDYKKMAEMFTIAEQQNPDQLLENPYKLGDTPIETIAEGVESLREQEWVKVYNQVVDLIKKEKIERAKKKIEIAILINPKKGENYFTLANIFIHKKDTTKAIEIVNQGLEAIDTYSMLHLLKADLSLQNNELKIAEQSYLKAIKYSDDPGPIMRNLLYVYIDMGNNQKAIDYAIELISKFPNDADIYYNVGVLYQRMAQDIEVHSKNKYNELNEMERPTENIIRELYSDFKQLRKYASFSKDYFYEALDLEQEEKLDTKNAISEMKSAINQMDNIFIPSIRETARLASIELE